MSIDTVSVPVTIVNGIPQGLMLSAPPNFGTVVQVAISNLTPFTAVLNGVDNSSGSSVGLPPGIINKWVFNNYSGAIVVAWPNVTPILSVGNPHLLVEWSNDKDDLPGTYPLTSVSNFPLSSQVGPRLGETESIPVGSYHLPSYVPPGYRVILFNVIAFQSGVLATIVLNGLNITILSLLNITNAIAVPTFHSNVGVNLDIGTTVSFLNLGSQSATASVLYTLVPT
ncbi:MAG: hypothetical protein ACREHG_03725 [Candidatus Saccharimonadales bacterium]